MACTGQRRTLSASLPRISNGHPRECRHVKVSRFEQHSNISSGVEDGVLTEEEEEEEGEGEETISSMLSPEEADSSNFWIHFSINFNEMWIGLFVQHPFS